MNGPGNGHYVTPAMVEQQAAAMREHYRRGRRSRTERPRNVSLVRDAPTPRPPAPNTKETL